MKIPFTKAHSNGNDFIIIKDHVKIIKQSESLIKSLCNRHFGIGSDGIIVISDIKNNYFKMDYYNCDGSWETFCANGAKCATLFMNMNTQLSEFNFSAGDGLHKSKVVKNNIFLKMLSPKYQTDAIIVDGFKGRLVNSGARHFVINIDSIEENNIIKHARNIRYSHKIHKEGVNVNFIKRITNNNIYIWTYEKGIEKIMNSCGSGAVASAYHISKLYNINKNIVCIQIGGKQKIKFDNNWDNVWIESKATLLYHSNIDTSLL